MDVNELKKQYKKAIFVNLDNIRENVNDIIDFMFKNSTKCVEISMKIEPGTVVGWECKAHIHSRDCNNDCLVMPLNEREDFNEIRRIIE